MTRSLTVRILLLLVILALVQGCVPTSYRISTEMERAANGRDVERLRALRSGTDGEEAAKMALRRMRTSGNLELARMLISTGTSPDAVACSSVSEFDSDPIGKLIDPTHYGARVHLYDLALEMGADPDASCKNVFGQPFSLAEHVARDFPDRVGKTAPVRRQRPTEVLAPSQETSPRQSPPAAIGDPGRLELGRYHALVIGNNAYLDLDPLETAQNDARAVAALLEDQYGFTADVLLDATRQQIVSALARYRRTLEEGDNLLLFYAGHGWVDEETEEGYWLPVDASREDPGNWISNATITTALRGIQAKRILVVADSCYSGSLTRGIRMETRSPGWIDRLARKRARVVLTSGGMEPVLDGGGDGHSVFTREFLRILGEADQIVEGASLFSSIRRPVMVNSNQTPEYGDIRLSGHDGGDFLFVRSQAQRAAQP